MTEPKFKGMHNAKLPTAYVEAKNALANCQRIDECKDWADKAAAMLSYAKQAQDDTLTKQAMRIKVRAMNRCGELLKQIESASGARTDKPGSATGHRLTRKGAATDAGLSKRQQRDALRIANIPEDDFEAAVESDDPPTVTELSEAGKRQAAAKAYRLAPKPPGFKDATKLFGDLRRFVEFCNATDPKQTAEAMDGDEKREVLANMKTVVAWFDSFQHSLEPAE